MSSFSISDEVTGEGVAARDDVVVLLVGLVRVEQMSRGAVQLGVRSGLF